MFWANLNFQVIGQTNERVWNFQGSGYANSDVVTITYTTKTPYNIQFEGSVSGSITISSETEALNASPLVEITSTTSGQFTTGQIHIKAPKIYGRSSILGNFSYFVFKKDNQANSSLAKKIFFIGDSITAGFHCNSADYPNCQFCINNTCNCSVSTTQLYRIKDDGTIDSNPSGDSNFLLKNNCSLSYDQFLIQHFKEQVQVYNFAIPGLTAAQFKNCPPFDINIGWSEFSSVMAFSDQTPTMLNRLLTEPMIQLQPEIIFISLGTNDALKCLQDSGQYPPSSSTSCSLTNPLCGCVQATYEAIADIINKLSPKYPNTQLIVLFLSLMIVYIIYKLWKQFMEILWKREFNNIQTILSNI